MNKRECAAAVGLNSTLLGVEERKDLIARQAAHILKRCKSHPKESGRFRRLYLSSKNFSKLRREIIEELLKQAKSEHLSWEIKEGLILPLEVEMKQSTDLAMVL